LFTEDNEANEGKIRSPAQRTFQSPTFVSFVAFRKRIRLRVLCVFVVKGRSLLITMPLFQLDIEKISPRIDETTTTDAVLSQLQEQARLTHVAVRQ
jgi:hypothetical protein